MKVGDIWTDDLGDEYKVISIEGTIIISQKIE